MLNSISQDFYSGNESSIYLVDKKKIEILINKTTQLDEFFIGDYKHILWKFFLKTLGNNQEMSLDLNVGIIGNSFSMTETNLIGDNIKYKLSGKILKDYFSVSLQNTGDWVINMEIVKTNLF